MSTRWPVVGLWVQMSTESSKSTVVESLKLIVQSQMILEELVRNQKRLEEMLRTLEEGATDVPE